MYIYGGRLFKPVEASGSSQASADTIFKYEQKENLVTATYAGGDIRFGQIIGRVDIAGVLDMRFQHITRDGELMTGHCTTTPELMANGKIRLHETWQWTCGSNEKGQSILEEM